MNLRINDGRYDGSGNTSAGFRRAHEPDQPQNLLALLAPITLPSHEATPLIRSMTCAHRTRGRPPCWHPLSTCVQAVCHMACGRQRCGALGHPFSVCRAACPLHVLPWGWDRRGGAREAGLGSSTLVCYALLTFVMLAEMFSGTVSHRQSHYCRVSFLGFPVHLEGRAHSVGSVFSSSTIVQRAVEACELVGGGNVEFVTRP